MTRSGHVKHSVYVLNHAEGPSEHAMYKVRARPVNAAHRIQGDVEPSLSKKGVAVRFTGVETLTTAGAMDETAAKKKRGELPSVV